jgi:uncharacterized protein (TIGR02217 family)
LAEQPFNPTELLIMALAVFSPPPGIAWPVKRRPTWKTTRLPALSGAETTQRPWSYPRRQYELPFEFLRKSLAELQYMEAFYNSVGGSAGAWLYDDPIDRAVVDQSFGTGDAVTRAFGLVRTQTGGAASFTEPVFAPNAITNIKVNGVATAAYVLGTTGLITFTVAPAAAATITWTGTYRWICRFDDDNLEFSQSDTEYFDLAKLSFTTLKLAAA